MRDYPWMSYAAAHVYESEAARLGVSRVARSTKGFMREYQRARTSERMRKRVLPPGVTGGLTWGQKRRGFIARHLQQYHERPTYGRYLALIMWAYKPPGPSPGVRGSPRITPPRSRRQSVFSSAAYTIDQ